MKAEMSGQTTRGAEYTVLVNSCDSFEDCWQPFFLLLRRYWPECGAPLLLVTETKEWHHEGLGIRCSKVQRAGEGRLTWSECLIRSLDQLDTPLVLYFQDDYFLHRPVRADFVERAVTHMLEHPEVKHIGLTKHGSHGPYLPTEHDWLHRIRRDARYRISTQAGLWRVDALRSYLRSEENGWMFEIFGTWRAARRNETFLCAEHDTRNGGAAIDYLHTGIIKGKWLREIQSVFESNGIHVDYSRRGFYVPKHPLLHKFEVGSRLLERPRYFMEQYFRGR
jgi:hypothetical protein